jgi:hypothetical protein
VLGPRQRIVRLHLSTCGREWAIVEGRRPARRRRQGVLGVVVVRPRGGRPGYWQPGFAASPASGNGWAPVQQRSRTGRLRPVSVRLDWAGSSPQVRTNGSTSATWPGQDWPRQRPFRESAPGASGGSPGRSRPDRCENRIEPRHRNPSRSYLGVLLLRVQLGEGGPTAPRMPHGAALCNRCGAGVFAVQAYCRA